VDLSAWDGKDVDVSISYAQDWQTQGLGVWIDDIDGPGTSGDTDFESGMSGWVGRRPVRHRERPQPAGLDRVLSRAKQSAR